MKLTRRTRLCIAIAAGMPASVFVVGQARGQQSPDDQTVFLNASDAVNSSSFAVGPTYQWGSSSTSYSTLPYTNSTVLPSGTAPTAGYAYVDTGSTTGTGLLRTPVAGTTAYTFAGDSLAIVPYNGQANLYNTSTGITNAQDTTAALEIYGNTSGQSITVGNLILGNGGAIINSSVKNTLLNGTIDLLPTGTSIDGVTTTVGGGIIDTRTGDTGGLVLNATLIGAGQLHFLSTGGSSATTLTLNGSNSNFSGGVLVDNTIGSGSGSGNLMLLNINTPTALGTGTFTIGSANSSGTQSSGSGPEIDNTSAGDETLTTNPAQQWNGNFQFKGTHSIYMGTGAVNLGANVTLACNSSVMAVNSINTGSYTLTVNAGSTNQVLYGYGALEVPNLAALTGNVTLGINATLAFPAANNTPAQFAAAAASSYFYGNLGLLGIDTNGVTGPYNLSSNLPSGTYGINKVGPGTLLVSGSNAYSGMTAISNGTLMIGSANALGNSSTVFFGGSGASTDGTLDLNGYSISIAEPNNGAATANVSTGGLITNSSATPSVLTLVAYQGSVGLGNSTYFGSINGNLSIVVAFPAPTSSSTPVEVLNGTNTYTGTTTLQSGVLETSSAKGIPSTPQGVIFAGGILELSGLDPSAAFNQSPGQQYNIVASGATTFASGLNSSGGTLTLGNANVNGASTLTLTAANFYSGPTFVNSGTLVIANPQALAGTSGVTVNGNFANPNITGSTPVFSTLQINDNSGLVGLSGGALGGTPITVNLSGVGSSSSFITYRVGVTNHTAGVAYYGALQGVAGASDTWAGNINLVNAPVGISGGFSNGSSGGILTIAGSISGTGPLILGLNGHSTTVLAGSNSYTGETQLTAAYGVGSTVQLGANFAIPADSGLDFANNNAPLQANSSFVYGSEILDLNGFSTSTAYVTSSTSTMNTFSGTTYSTISATSTNGVVTNTKNGSTGTLAILGAASSPYLGVFQDGSTTAKLALNFDGGVQTMTGTNNYSGGTTVSAGTLIVNNVGAIGTGNLTINSPGGAILRSFSAATAFTELHSGYANGIWTGNGINSSFAASDPSHLTAVGMFVGPTSFEGQSVNAGDVALKLTYYGDANLDGVIDGSDYTLIDYAYGNNQNASNSQLTGWQNGDFNYDGVIDGSDYTLIDNAFNTQGAQFTAIVASSTAQIAGTSAVPEPTAVALLGLAATGLLGRRRRLTQL